MVERVTDDLRRGAVFLDLHAKAPCRLDRYAASIQDGRGQTVHRRLFIVQAEMDGSLIVRQPTLLLDLILAAGQENG